jgi:hypothetical protein
MNHPMLGFNNNIHMQMVYSLLASAWMNKARMMSREIAVHTMSKQHNDMTSLSPCTTVAAVPSGPAAAAAPAAVLNDVCC